MVHLKELFSFFGALTLMLALCFILCFYYHANNGELNRHHQTFNAIQTRTSVYEEATTC